MNARSARTMLAAAILALAASAPARAATFDINFDLVFDQLSLSGQSTDDDAPALGTDRTPVDSNLAVQLSKVAASTLAGSLSFDSMLNATMSLTGTFFLDLTFITVNAGDSYAPGLSDPLLVAADAANPLVVTMDFGITISQLLAIETFLFANPGATIAEAVANFNANNDPSTSSIPDIDPKISDPGVKVPLGLDLDGAGGNDAVEYFGESLMLIAANATSVDLTVSDAEFASLFDDFANGQNVALDVVGSIDVMATGLTFEGGIVDQTDPTFMFMDMDLIIQASSPLAQAPEPLTLALLGLGLAGMAGLRRRRG